jgi:signal transduction histidine kinase
MVPFYKTNFFFGIIILIISLLSILSFYLYLRIKNIENKTKERIAMDLHDEVGTTLTRMLMQLNKIPLNSPYYESIKIGLSDALFSIRAFINSMNGQKLDMLSFKDDIREFMNNAFSNTEVKHFSNFKLLGNFKINQELYRDMKLCVYEAISNIIKHSDAKNVNLELSITDKNIFIKITDDSNTKPSDIHINYGNGITNMRKRTERHQGSFILTNNEQKGIEILFNFDTHTLNDIR